MLRLLRHLKRRIAPRLHPEEQLKLLVLLVCLGLALYGMWVSSSDVLPRSVE